MNQGKLIAIAIREKSRAPMVQIRRGEVTANNGVTGDLRGKPGPRQVTVMSADAWHDACSVVDQDLPWTTRRANLLVEGLSLVETTGLILRVGSVVLKITGETEPCGRMDQQCMGLREALRPDWRGGVCCQVVSGGPIEPGAPVTLECT